MKKSFCVSEISMAKGLEKAHGSINRNFLALAMAETMIMRFFLRFALPFRTLP